MKEKFMKNGVFSLEYDKETLKDMVLELQEKNQKQKEVIDKAIEYIENNLSLGVNTFGSIYSIGANNVLDILKEGKG